jgi:hypothetical protein
MNTDLEDIRARAYRLWEETGKPDGRDEEFWHQAERELMEKTESVKLESPEDIMTPVSGLAVSSLEHGVDAEIVLFDEIADRADQDSLDPALHVGEVELAGRNASEGL